MKIPYGQSNFKTVISENYVYVDKTRFIRTLEDEGRFSILLRPRRFGKSLFLSMLSHYYDMNFADEFASLFGQLAIGKNPTASHNQHQVLFLEFSGISTDSRAGIYAAFTSKVNNALLTFLGRYGYAPAAHNDIVREPTPAGKLETLLRHAQGQKIYVFIDEYDHFANSLLAEDLSHFRNIMGKGGFVRAFYELIKTGTQQGVIDRLFITGVTPVMLDSLTSGFNVVDNLSTHACFNDAIGFTRKETEGLIKPLADGCGLQLDSLMANVTAWYNGYCFSESCTAAGMYNADMVLYFIKHFDQKTCAYPRRMLDENIASDYGKILALFSIGDRNENYQVLEELIEKNEIVAKQRRKFDFDKGFDRNDFVSLLYYMGFITFKGSLLGRESYQIPNYVIKVLYFEYFKVELERLNVLTISDAHIEDSIIALALHNDPAPLLDEIRAILQQFSNRDFIKLDEKHIKTLLLTLLFQSPVYAIKSEPEMNHKYPDILLLERSPYAVQYEHLLELKYCKKSERSKNPRIWQDKLAEGVRQVQGYLQLPEVKMHQKLSAWVLLTDGDEVIVEPVVKPQE